MLKMNLIKYVKLKKNDPVKILIKMLGALIYYLYFIYQRNKRLKI